MAVCEIALMGNPLLRQPAEPVVDPTMPEVAALIVDMIETMDAAVGIGLAAPQISVPLRVVILRIPRDPETDPGDLEAEAADPEARDGTLLTLINPIITPVSDDRSDGWEACLSVPGLRGLVPRFRHIRYHGLSPDGSQIGGQASDYYARVVQHECDHLDGILYPQRMTDLSTLMFTSEDRHGVARDAPV